MELKYCERCGSIVKSEFNEAGDNPHAQVICEACLAEGVPESSSGADGGNETGENEERGSASDASIPSADSMEYFSSQTIAVKKKQHFGNLPEPAAEPAAGKSTLTLQGGDEEIHLDATRELPLGLGSATPARSADRIQFNCVHCHSKLLVKPVKKLSQMACPRCGKKMFIDPNGQVAKAPGRPEEVETVSFQTGKRTVVPSMEGNPEPGATVRVKRPADQEAAAQAPRVGSFRLRVGPEEAAPPAQQGQPARTTGSSSAVRSLGGSKGLSNLVHETQVRQSDSARIRAGGAPRLPGEKEKNPSFQIPSGSASGSFQVRAAAGAPQSEEEGFTPIIQRDGGPVQEPGRKAPRLGGASVRRSGPAAARSHEPEMVKVPSPRNSPYLVTVIFGLLLISPFALLGVLLPPTGSADAARPEAPAAASESWPLVRSLGERVEKGVLRILEGIGMRKP